jgi:predicted esterase
MCKSTLRNTPSASTLRVGENRPFGRYIVEPMTVRPFFLVAAMAISCATRRAPDSTPAGGVVIAAPATDADPTDPSDAAASLPPLEAPSGLIRLVVPDHKDATVSVPLGATERRPLVLALHGNYDRPEWQCETWRDAMKGYPFVLCPRGVSRKDAPASLDRWTYPKPADVRHEIEAALAALDARFGDYIAPGPILYIGFSLGAILGVGIVAGDAARFPRAVLIEGGQSGWSEARAKAYAASGGKRILFACGQRSCKAEAKGAEKLLARAGIETESVYGGEVGHAYDGPVAAEIARALPWLLGDDPRWPLR